MATSHTVAEAATATTPATVASATAPANAPQTGSPADELEHKIIEALLATYEHSDLIDQAVAAIASRTANQGDTHRAELVAVRADIAAAEQTVDRYLAAFEKAPCPRPSALPGSRLSRRKPPNYTTAKQNSPTFSPTRYRQLACLQLSGLWTAYGPIWKGEWFVARKKGTFTPEFRQEAARLVVENGRRIVDVAGEIGVGETTLGNWVKAYREAHAGEEPPLELSERARLRELERKNRELEMENNFLKRAAAYFAKEQR